MRIRTLVPTVALAASALLLGACSSDGGDSTGTDGATAAGTGFARVDGALEIPEGTQATCGASGDAVAITLGTPGLENLQEGTGNPSASALIRGGKVEMLLVATPARVMLPATGSALSATHQLDGTTHTITGSGEFRTKDGATAKADYEIVVNCG